MIRCCLDYVSRKVMFFYSISMHYHNTLRRESKALSSIQASQLYLICAGLIVNATLFLSYYRFRDDNWTGSRYDGLIPTMSR